MNLTDQFKHQIMSLNDSLPTLDEALVAADFFDEVGDLRMLASALDRAWGLKPEDEALKFRRQSVLQKLSVVEHGIRFCYVPMGTFLMGSDHGEPDESPVHPVAMQDYWLSETPVTWAAYFDLMGWGTPNEPKTFEGNSRFYIYQAMKICSQYCGSELDSALEKQVKSVALKTNKAFNKKPMVAIGWQDAELLANKLSTDDTKYSLPSERQWEKAARGGLIQQRYSWGSAPPTPEICDFDHFGVFEIRDPKTLAANGYQLYGMCGGVWEWTSDGYDAQAYANASSTKSPELVSPDEASQHKVLRGGSWSDCADACTVSFRMSQSSSSWFKPNDRGFGGSYTPNIGFRLCRTQRGAI